MCNAKGTALSLWNEYSKFFFLSALLGCGQINKQKQAYISIDTTMEFYKTFDTENHLQPLFDKSKFDTSHGWDFGWAVLEPINIAKTRDDDKILAKRFSPGQKALYFIWYLDAEVTNGGFIQFYWNDYREYIPPIIDGLKLIGDTSMLDLVTKADKEYLTNKEKFDVEKQKVDWEPLYNNLKKFDEYDSIYYKTHDKTMELIEKYARQNPSEFVKFR
jgi:hypothetical protein